MTYIVANWDLQIVYDRPNGEVAHNTLQGALAHIDELVEEEANDRDDYRVFMEVDVVGGGR